MNPILLFSDCNKCLRRLLFLAIISTFLFACAESNVSRDVASGIDMGVQNAKSLVSDPDIANSYGNSSQAVKGALIGGTAGALVGAATSGIGVWAGGMTGAVLGASYGNYIDVNTSLEDKLRNRGVTVVELGDQTLIMIPSARLFEYMTSTIKPRSYSTLEMIARYINKYRTIMVKISGYTNANSSCSADLSLSNMQAHQIARYLNASGLNARMVYAQGYGGTNLVVDNKLGWDESDNYRIEITFEKLYV